jgi:threonyl-tRNA synthetase
MNNNPASSAENLRHSLAHLLAAAVEKHFPQAKRTIGPTIDNGFYYDFDFSGGPVPGPDDLPKIEGTMREIMKTWKGFTRKEVSPAEAKEYFSTNPFKVELITEFEAENSPISFYTSGEFTDLCRGGHVEDLSAIDPQCFTLTKIAGAYWRGNEKNAMLTRIYGLAFPTKAELDAHLIMLAEAEKRDHKKLGPELDLFTFSSLVGSGLPLWTPKGTLVRNLLDGFVWEMRKARGYDQVEIPHITKKELYQTSGHWDKFKDDLFRITTREGHEFAMKPMNCPHHTQIYARKKWSYRELPQRYANTTMVYRDEQSGELAGLSRVRSITQDDAHVFCRLNQVKGEMLAIWDIVENLYGAFGFSLRVRLSMRDPQHMEKYLGEPAKWDFAENTLREVAAEKHTETFAGPGEAAFYGPKLDFMAKDSIGREWQVATIQMDMNMPERFDLSCVNEKGENERIVMIHAAIMGSIERFLAVLIEHTAGNFPTWLSPVQVQVLPVSDKFAQYGKDVLDTLTAAGIRAEMPATDSTLGSRLREARKSKVPYMLVLGEKEVTAGTVSVNSRDKGQQENTPTLQEFLALIGEEIRTKK